MSADMSFPDREVVGHWLAQVVELGASDLHIVVGYRPTLRVHGRLLALDMPTLSDHAVRAAITPHCPPRALEQLERDKNADFALEVDVGGTPQRCRINLFVSGPNIGVCIRLIQSEIPGVEWAGFPAALADRLAHFRNGLVLISGVTGAGKTTKLGD